MKVTRFVCGPLQENCYLVVEETTGKAVLMDPGGFNRHLLDTLQSMQGELVGILLTHGHFDHTGGVDEVRKMANAPVYIHRGDAPMLTDGAQNLSALFGAPMTCGPAQNLLEDGQEIQVGNARIRVIHTPGHSGGSVCFLGEGNLFSGDTLFAGSIGRTDFPGSDPKQMKASLQKLWNLPGDYLVYPGHGPETTLSVERLQNPYFRNEL